ncbi:LAMI_0E05754g1_1 [Lachancea mirantina]|uniref:Nucleolar protein 16 n=1 Tax=Lachancea mirantina TaxID=1230905 RepID=A0A1G4JLB5_9SACH|nr:LAMI_0E05754g1_1 [Lachancea mirantina]
MASVRKRKMAKSSVRKATRKHRDRVRKVNIHANPIIAENWDYSLTLAQNYKKLGLAAKLQTSAGGDEADMSKVVKKEPLVKSYFSDSDDDDDDKLGDSRELSNEETDENAFDANYIPEGEARIKRDENGNVIEVVHGKMKGTRPEEAGDHGKKDTGEKTEVVKLLENYASQPRVRQERKLSSREDEWLLRLYKKHGDNYKKMFFDQKLNVYQQTEGDIRKRILKWKAKNNID